MTAAWFNEDMRRRTGGAGLVVLLHLLAIAFLLNATVRAVRQTSPRHEGTIWFVLPPRVKPQPVRLVSAAVARAHARHFSIPRSAITTAPSIPDFAAHGDLHALLFDCAPENFANLQPEQRAQCLNAPGSVKPGDSEVYAEHATGSNSAAHWARGVMRKHEPLLLPCMPPGLGTLFCLVNAAKEGHFDLDEAPGYGDKPVRVGVPNGGDPPDHPPR